MNQDSKFHARSQEPSRGKYRRRQIHKPGTPAVPGCGKNACNVKLRKVLYSMWRMQDSRCHWCGQPTVLPWNVPQVIAPKKVAGRHPALPENMATRDHLVSRLKGPPRSKNSLRGGVVMACKRCNEQRSVDEQIELGIMAPLPQMPKCAIGIRWT